MTDHNPNQTKEAAFAEGFIGVSLMELEGMSDAALATWQSGWNEGTNKHILADKEWQRRIALRGLREQFKLEERLANGNRWWSIAAATIGVLGTLTGVWLGKYLESQSEQAPVSKAQLQTAPSATPQQSVSSNSPSSQPVKKTP